MQNLDKLPTRTINAARRAVMFYCPKCGAQPDEHCRNRKGERLRGDPHKARCVAAMTASTDPCNTIFGQYVRRTEFSLSLTKWMISVLLQMYDAEVFDHGSGILADAPNFHSTTQSLIRRGMIEHHKKIGGFRLTAVGRTMCRLLRLAGFHTESPDAS